MFSNKILRTTLLISLTLHAIFLFHASILAKAQKYRKEEPIQISYVKQLPRKQTKETIQKINPRPITQRQFSPPQFLNINKSTSNQAMNRRLSSIIPTAKLNLNRPALELKPDMPAIKKIITLPAMPLDMNKINNPSYISYYQIVREKIKRAAYKNYTGSEIGYTTISFMISSEGYLKDLHFAEDKTSSNAYLREISLTSIKEAAPFPAFPKELDFPELSFNIAITFGVEEA